MSKILIDLSVVEQALEALEKTHTQPGCEQWQAERKASVALRAAPEQEGPVARVIDNGTPEGSTEWIPYSMRQAPIKTGDLLYTHPPRREWVGLTADEMVDLQNEYGVTTCPREFAAIEAKLKEKNT